MIPTSLQAAQARVEVRDMRAATQGLQQSNRYVHVFYKIVMDYSAPLAWYLSSMEWLSTVYLHLRHFYDEQSFCPYLLSSWASTMKWAILRTLTAMAVLWLA